MIKTNNVVFLIVACTFVSVGVYMSIKKSEQQTAQSIAVTELFAISMTDSKGQVEPLAQWKGKTLLVNFWATWCAPCVQEIPELSALQPIASKKNVQIIGIGIDSAANIREFSSKYKISYPLYIADKNGLGLPRKFGNLDGGLPFTVLIDQHGQIKKSYLGRLKFEELKRDLELP